MSSIHTYNIYAMLSCLNSKYDKWLSNKQEIESKRQLPISYLYVKTTWRPYECNTSSNNESIRFNEGVSIIINFNLMDIYINKSMVPT
jgi:hypothetical protein